MQFVVIARDGTDEKAMERRMAHREGHLVEIAKRKERGEMLLGAALLDENDKMCGSIIVAEFPSRRELDAWLAVDPYVTGKVWDKIEVTQCKVAPSFAGIFSK